MDKNQELLAEFTNYCRRNPELRFWQALRGWSGQEYIKAQNWHGNPWAITKDTFYWETRDGGPRKDASQTTYGLLAGRDLSK